MANTRGSRMRSNKLTSGDNKNENKIASASGTTTVFARYRTAIAASEKIRMKRYVNSGDFCDGS